MTALPSLDAGAASLAGDHARLPRWAPAPEQGLALPGRPTDDR